jgi:hypothetical protein
MKTDECTSVNSKVGVLAVKPKLDHRSHVYLSVTIEQFHFAFGMSLLNPIKIVFTHGPFHQLNTAHHDVQIQANQRLWLCIDPRRGVLLTIISANLPCIGKDEGKANRFYWIRFTAYSFFPFCPDISVHNLDRLASAVASCLFDLHTQP